MKPGEGKEQMSTGQAGGRETGSLTREHNWLEETG